MYLLATTSLLAGLAAAKVCQNITVPIVSTSRNGIFNMSQPTTNAEVETFLLRNNYQGQNYTEIILAGYETIVQPFNISATYCHPDSGPSSTLQVLSHGLGWDRFYWDLAYNNYNYSYVNYVVDKFGFSTFAYDQIGVGGSTAPDPLQIVSSQSQTGVLAAISGKLRNGTVPGVPKFSKIVHVGHSIGSINTYVMSAENPSLSDGITLTGFGQNRTWEPLYAAGVNLAMASSIIPSLYEGRPGCYYISQNPNAYQSSSFAEDFDVDLLQYTFDRRAPVTCGDRLTVAGAVIRNSSYPGPIHIVDGENDLLSCNGNCVAGPTGYPDIPSYSRNYMVYATPFQVDLIPSTGSALNVHYSFPESYSVITKFFLDNDLGPKKTNK